MVRAHPRSRGDHATDKKYPSYDQGSSPLARGPLRSTFLFSSSLGLIPARAGTTGRDIEDAADVWAHPRSRGDHTDDVGGVGADGGSSPLARGPLALRPAPARFAGLIPARAGTTPASRHHESGYRAHPRSRGDHDLLKLALVAADGSSPLARGPL